MSEQKQVRLGLIGCGNISRAHHRNVSEGKVPNCKITAVCDTDPEAMRQYDQYQHFADHHALIASGEVDAILICTPHYSHVPIAIDGLQAGVHVLIEKPLSPYGVDCQKLIDAYEAREDKSLICGEMFNQRTDPRYIKLKELIESGELGQLKRISWTITDWFRSDTYYASGGWRATWSGEGGGVLLNQSPHQLDLFQWIFGMPDRVQAHCHIGKWHDIEVEDDVTAYMEYDTGATATFVSTTGEAPGVNRLEVACDRGLITVVDDGLEWTRLEQGISQFSKETKESFGRPPRWEIKIPTKGGTGPQHAGILENFCASILDGAELIAPAAEGIHSVALANAMLLSSHEKRMLDMPMDHAAYEALLNERIAASKPKEKVVKVEANMDKSF